MATYTWTATDAQEAVLTRQLALVNRMRRQADPNAILLTATEYIAGLLTTASTQWADAHASTDKDAVRAKWETADATTRATVRSLLGL